MTKTEEIMELAEDYSSACSEYSDEEPSMEEFQMHQETKTALLTAIEELHRDATKWREYKARKDAVICTDCAKTHKTAIIALTEVTSIAEGLEQRDANEVA